MIDALSPLTNLINRLTPRSDDNEEPEFRRIGYQQPEYRPLFSNHEYPATPDQAFTSNDYTASFRVTPTSIKTLFINGPKKGEVVDVQSTFRQYECYSLPEPEFTKSFEYSEYRKESTFIVNEEGKLEEFVHWQQRPNETRADKLELIKYELIPITIQRDDYGEETINFGYIKPLPHPPGDILELIESNFDLARYEIQGVIRNLGNYLDRNNLEEGSLIKEIISQQMRINRVNMERFWYSNDDSNSLNIGNGIYDQISQTNTTTYTPAEASDFRRVMEDIYIDRCS